ncbi:MAG: TrkH family potassium uptake protein [Bacteroidales bacterium]
MYYGINYKSITRVIGALLCIESIFMLIPLFTAMIYGESDMMPFLQTFAITICAGGIMVYIPRENNGRIGKREGFLIVSLSWISISAAGALPLLLNGNVDNYTDAYFEAMSGFTTTGMTILDNIDSTTHGILLWRSLMQWMGGMGIILFTLAILPMLNSGGGIQLFSAEATGIAFDKLGPRISQTSKKLWGIYVAITLIMIIMLIAGPMSVFDAICTAFSATSTGGYSTRQASIASWNSAYVDYVVTAFMFISGMNFALIYRSAFRGYKNLFHDEELKWYLITTITATLLISVTLIMSSFYGDDIEKSVRGSLFTVVSALTSTGFATENFCNWGTFAFIIICLCMFIGGCAGSTAGGAKIIRLVVLLKNTANEFFRQLHPNAIKPVRLNGKVISYDLVFKVLAFIVVYIIVTGCSTMILALLGLSAEEAMNPDSTFIMLHPIGKWVLIFDMLVGRLEIFTVLILFSPYFWKK